MTKKTLGIDSSYEEVVKITKDYRDENVYPIIQRNLRALLKKQDQEAIRDQIKLVAPGKDFITGSGHGEESKFKGHRGDIIWRKRCPLLGSGYQKEEVEDKLIHLESCYTGKSLGPDFINKGSKAFFGYIDYFSLVDFARCDIALRCDAVIDIEISQNKTAEEICNLTIKEYKDTIRFLISAQNFEFAGRLKHDLDCFRGPLHNQIWGQINARI